jgi:hypothetical protein
VLVDLVMLLVHGLLSLALFGAPRSDAFRKQHSLWRFLGGCRDVLQGRERFLLDAWRILISMTRPLSLTLLAYVTALPSLALPMVMPLVWIALWLPLSMLMLFFQALLAASVLRHVRDASSYAYRRWRMPAHEARLLGWLTLAAFVVLFVANIWKEFV